MYLDQVKVGSLGAIGQVPDPHDLPALIEKRH
jgi:hypothetical protein